MKNYRPHTSSIGDAAAGVIALACYAALIFFWVFGLVIILAVFISEKRSGLVRFHAVQASLLWLIKVFAGGGIAFESLAAIITGNMGYLHSAFGWEALPAVLVARITVEVLVIVGAVIAGASGFNWRCWKVPGVGCLAMLICAHSARAAYTGGERVPEQCLPGWNSKVRRQAEADRDARRRNEQMQWTVPVQLPGRQAGVGAAGGEEPALSAQALTEKIYQTAVLTEDVLRNVPEKPPESAKKQKKRSAAAEPADIDAEFERRMGEGTKLSMLMRMIKRPGSIAWPAKKAAYARDDPNQALPPEMRDPLPPDTNLSFKSR